MKLDVILTPTLVKEDTLKGCLCAVIDVLRATSTIITALANGAPEVLPCITVEEAKKGAASLPKGSRLLGGEEMGQSIPGFDLGNSPLEYLTTEVVSGKVILFSTTNGTVAIRRAYAGCGCPVYIAALLNLSVASSAMVRTAACGQHTGIVILCSGRYGKPSAEDLFCAGLMVERIGRGLRESGIVPQLGDGASIAAGFAAANKGRSLEVLATSEHGRFLESLGFTDDLVFASRIDFYDAVPIFDGDRVVLLPQE